MTDISSPYSGSNWRMSHTATHCNTLQHTATHCNTLQHTAPRCNIDVSSLYLRSECRISHIPTSTTLQHTATHCKKCNTLQQRCIKSVSRERLQRSHLATLQHTATHGSTRQHTATHCNTLLHTATQVYQVRIQGAKAKAIAGDALRVTHISMHHVPYTNVLCLTYE